jgi:F-type H+-transporting ATPase subunit b
MDFGILNDATLWVSVSFILFVLLVIRPLTSMFSKNIDIRISTLKKEIDEAKKLKIEAENLLTEHKEKEKKNTQYIEELKKQKKKEAMDIEDRIKKEIELAIIRKEENYEIIVKQMESNLKERLQNEIMTKTLKFTQSRIEKNISKKHNDDFIDESLKKLPKQLS